MTDRELCAFLELHGVVYQRFDHEPVFTCEQAESVVPADVPAVHTKNIFVRDKKGRRHWLIVTTCAKAVDLKATADVLGADNLSFASAERLQRLLGVTPGAVTILGLINDHQHEVSLVVDDDVWKADALRAHPLINTATLVLSRSNVESFCALTGHVPTIVSIPSRA